MEQTELLKQTSWKAVWCHAFRISPYNQSRREAEATTVFRDGHGRSIRAVADGVPVAAGQA